MKSAVEQCGIFVGIRSGICDILSSVDHTKAKTIAVYPDYNYSDTQWKAIQMYRLDSFDDNIQINSDDNLQQIVDRIIKQTL